MLGFLDHDIFKRLQLDIHLKCPEFLFRNHFHGEGALILEGRWMLWPNPVALIGEAGGGGRGFFLDQFEAGRLDLAGFKGLIRPVIPAIEWMNPQPDTAVMRVGKGGFSGERQTRKGAINRVEIRVLQVFLGAVIDQRLIVPANEKIAVIGIGREPFSFLDGFGVVNRMGFFPGQSCCARSEGSGSGNPTPAGQRVRGLHNRGWVMFCHRAWLRASLLFPV